MASALSFPDQVRRLRLKVAAQPNHLDEVCRAFRSIDNLILSAHLRIELSKYVSDYINEEILRGKRDIDAAMVENAIDAFIGGANLTSSPP